MSDLGITCGQLRREVGFFLGFDRDPANWSADTTQDVWDVIDAGLRQFYRPARLSGDRMSYQWSFLRPHGLMQLQTNIDDYDMPLDFAGLDGSVYFVRDDTANEAIQIVNQGMMLQRRQAYWYTSTMYSPSIASIVPKKGDGVNPTGYELQVWPKPDQPYTLKFRYFARQNDIRNDSSVPMGGSEHAETIRASVISAAEAKYDDERGGKHSRFLERLMASMDFDRRIGSSRNMGYNSDPGYQRYNDDGYVRAIGGLVTIESIPDPPVTPPVSPSGGLINQGGFSITSQDGTSIIPQTSNLDGTQVTAQDGEPIEAQDGEPITVQP